MAFSNNSIKFDGVDGYVDVEYPTLLNFDRANAFSISCWAKTKSTEPISTIISKMDSSSGTGYRISMNASGQYEVILRNTAVTDSLRVRTVADGYNEGGWHHLVVTYNGIGGILIYIDGLVKATTTVYNTLTSSIANFAPFQIGAYDGTNVFDGSIDEVAVFTSAISATRVLEIFGSAKPTDLAIAAYSPLTYSSEYDGTGEYIDYSWNGPTRYAPNVPFSLAIWMRSYRPHDNGTEALMSQWTWSPGPGSLGWLFFRYDDGSTSHVGFTMRKNDSTYFLKRTDTASGVNISDGIWHFVVVTYDGSGDENGIKLYIDSREVTSGLYTASAGTVDTIDYATYGTKLRVGQTHSSANAYRGRLLHSAAIGKELSADEVVALYGSGKPLDLTDVVDSADIDHWCTLGDGCTTGSSACPDLSPNAAHGTATSMEAADFTIDDLPPSPIFNHSPLTRSLLLDGVDEYVEYVEDTGNQLIRTEPFTISVWFKVVTDQEGFLIGRYHNPAGPGANRGWYVRYLAGGSLRWGMVVSSDTGTGNTYLFWTLSAGVNDGEWHQWTVAFNGNNVSPHVNSMLDGVYKPESSHSITLGGGIQNQPMAHPGEPLRIGYGDDGVGGYDYFAGNIGHHAIHKGIEMDLWDMALLYAAGNPQNLAAQINSSYLSFWDTLGDGDALGAGNMVDLSVYGNNGEAFNVESGDFEADIPVGRDLSDIPEPDTICAWWRMGDSDTYPILLDQITWPYAFPAAYDLSGNGYHGLATNMEAADAVRDVPRTDFCKYSVIFDGSTNYITMGNVLNFERTDQFSISFWMKFVSAGTVAVSKMGPSLFQGYAVWAGSGINFQLADGSGSVQVETGNVGMADGEWHHCVVTWDGDVAGGAAGALCYIDGSLRSTTTTTDTLTGSMLNTASFRVGGRELGPLYYGGNITEVAVYDSELSAADVEWIYNDGLPRDLLDGYAPSNIVAWWRVGTIDQTNWQTRDLIWGSSAETSQISDMSRLVNHATATNTEAGDFTTDTPGGEAQYSVNLNDHLFSIRSINFDGSDDYIAMGDAFNFERNDTFSFSFWVKVPSGAADGEVFAKMSGGTAYRGYDCYIGASGVNFRMQYNALANADQMHVRDTTDIRDGTWHHVAITKAAGTGDESEVTIYLDGVDQAPLTVVSNTLSTDFSSATPFELGRRYDSGAGAAEFTGDMDEVSIYDKELSAAEVTAIYNGGDPTDLSLLSTAGNLAGWWRMGEGDIYPTIYDNGLVPQPFAYPKIFDMSGYDNHGTMTNMEVDDSVPDYPRSAFTKYSVDFGSGQYVTMGNESELDFDLTHVFSLSCWFNTIMSTDGTLISKMENTPYKGYLLYVRAGGKIAFRLINTWNTNLIDVETTNTWNDGDWHHVTLVYDGSQSAAGVTIYIDGVSEGLNTIFDTLSATTLNTATFRLAYRDSGHYPYVGKMADAVVYNIGLSAADASWMYNSGVPLDLRDGYDDGDGYNDGYIVGYWRLGNGHDELGYVKKIQDWVWGDVSTKETTTITDASFLTNDLTLTNVDADEVTPETPGGISNYSCYFNGVDSFAYTALGTAHYGIDNGDVLSLSGWVKTTSSDAFDYLWGNAASGTTKAGYHVYLAAGKPTFEMAASDLTAVKLIEQTTSATVNDGYWHHIVFTEYYVSNNNYVVSCYIDGVSVALTNLNNGLGTSAIGGSGFSVGGRGASGDDPIDGYIDEVSVYRKSLTQSDVTSIYNAGAPVDLRALSSSMHMMGWWRMGDSYGIVGTAVNTTAAGKNGDVPGTTVYSSKSLRFDVSNEYVDIGNPSELNFEVDDPFSISVWVKNYQQASFQGVVGKITGGVGWYLRVYNNTISSQANSYLQFVMDGTGLIEVYMGDRRGAFPYNEWVNVVVTYDGSNDGTGVKFYMNGELYPTHVRYNTANTTIQNAANFTAGLANSSYNLGNMDELSVWDKELSQADVTAIWNGGDPDSLFSHSSWGNLVGWWKMSDGYGSIDGTMTNMSSDDINGDIPVASPEHLITAAGSSEIDFGATYNHKWTLSAWIKTDNEFGIIVNKNYSSDFSGWGMRLLGGYPTLWWASNPATLLTEQRSDVRVDDGYWHHVVAVREKIVYVVPDAVSDYDGNMTNMEVADIQADTPGGISEYSMAFDGVNEYVTMGDVLDFDYNEAVSISVWIKSTDSSGSIIISKRDGSEKGWFLSLATTGAINAGMINTLATNALNMLTTATGFNDGAWHHVVWAKSTSPLISGSKIYVDGVDRPLTTVWNNLSSSVLNDGSLTMASDNDGQGYIYTGNIDEVAIYDKQLSSAEVTAIYNSGAPNDITALASATNLLSWWRMGDDYLSSRFYVDGVLTGTVTVQDTNAGNTISNSGTVSIGLAKGSGDGEQPFIGKISEIAVWNGTFDSIEVSEIYNSGSPPNLIDLSTEPRLRGWWRCGDDNGNPGTYTSFATTAKLGDAPGEEYSTSSFDLDGSNEYVAVDSGIAYERTDAFSVSCWFKAQTRNEWPMSQMSTYGWYLDELDNTPYWRMEGATGAIRIYFGYEDIIWADEWYHMVVTYDGSSTAAGTKMYIDGVEVPAIHVTSDTLAGSIAGGTINIGNREGVYFDGQVDEASIWSKELSAFEVDEIYNGGRSTNLTRHSAIANLDGWWKLGEDNGNDGTMVNMLSGDIVLNAPREAGAIGEQIDYFLMRGIDSACGALTYYYWLVTETPDFLGAQVNVGDLPCGGPLIDIVVASSWSVIN